MPHEDLEKQLIALETEYWQAMKTPPAPLPKGSACVVCEECGDMLVCDVGFCGERLCEDFVY